jgi:hypothetical protein
MLCPLHFREERANGGSLCGFTCRPRSCALALPARHSPAEALTMQQGLPSQPQSGGFCTHLSPRPQKAPVEQMGGTSLSTENP